MLPHAAQYCKDAHQDLMPYLHQSLHVLLLSLSSPLIYCFSFINKKELKWIICRPTRCAMASFNYGHGLRNPLTRHYPKIKGTEALFILMVHRGFLEILRIKRSFYAIGGVLNENQGVPWIGKVCKSKFGQIWIIFGHYLAKFGHPIFFHWVK